MRVYLAQYQVAVRHGLVNYAELVGRILLFAGLLIIFSRLWAVAGETGGLSLDFTSSQLIWYVAVTEWLLLSIPMINTAIQQDIQDGTIAYKLLQPTSFCGMHFARALGEASVFSLTLGFAGLLWVTWLVGPPPLKLDEGLAILLLAASAMMLGILCQMAIGLAAFWMSDSLPVYWVWQKCLFILGGLILPLSFYPSWLQAVAHVSPFKAILYGPAAFAVLGLGSALELAWSAIVWIVIAIAVNGLLFRFARRSLVVYGG